MNSPLDANGLPVGHTLHPLETTPRETKKLLDARAAGEADFVLIDCRLPQEVAVTTIAGSELIPLQQMQAHAETLMALRDKKVIVYCRSGGRSLQFVQVLAQNGFADVKSMAGGILLWNRDVIPAGRSIDVERGRWS